MKKLLAILAVAVLICGGMVGCGEQSGGNGDGGGKTVVARRIQDGAKKLDQFQVTCPVCNGKPIKKDLYHDVEEGPRQGRVYFDKEECLKKFKENPSEYLQGEFNPPE